jgi:hypothetical protein
MSEREPTMEIMRTVADWDNPRLVVRSFGPQRRRWTLQDDLTWVVETTPDNDATWEFERRVTMDEFLVAFGHPKTRRAATTRRHRTREQSVAENRQAILDYERLAGK